MSRAQYAAIVARQRQISKQNENDQSGNEVSNLKQDDKNEKTIDKKVTFQENTTQNSKEELLQKQLNEKLKQQQQQQQQQKRQQELLRRQEQQKKQQEQQKKQQEQQRLVQTVPDFSQINQTFENNYAVIIKNLENVIDGHKSDKDRMIKQIESMNNRQEIKIKQYEETINTLNETVKNLTEMLNSKFLEIAKNPPTKILETKDTSTHDIPDEPNIKVNLNVIDDAIDVKLEVNDGKDDDNNSEN